MLFRPEEDGKNKSASRLFLSSKEEEEEEEGLLLFFCLQAEKYFTSPSHWLFFPLVKGEGVPHSSSPFISGIGDTLLIPSMHKREENNIPKRAQLSGKKYFQKQKQNTRKEKDWDPHPFRKKKEKK